MGSTGLLRTFDLEWTTAMLELVELTKIEFPRQIESWPTVRSLVCMQFSLFRPFRSYSSIYISDKRIGILCLGRSWTSSKEFTFCISKFSEN